MGRADLHIHTVYSDGMMNPEMVINHVIAQNQLDVIAITDHDTILGGLAAVDYLESHPELAAHIDVIVGSEISSRDGHILGLFLQRDVPPHLTAKETVDLIHDQGGIAIAAHPYTFFYRISKRLAGLKGVGNEIKAVDFDAVETKNSNPTEFISNYYTQWINRINQKLPETGSSDGHFLSAIGKTYTEFEGSTVDELKTSIEQGKVKSQGNIWHFQDLIGYIRDKRRLNRFLEEHNILLHLM
ncbi:PHP domain-containing protein [Fulvivirgaceae bacterium BMA10]|uniref:PHP domain-containing protein n=1 Tax=Splendidivirga corallicola TaxID=3051826 RepID=A0ABT8KHL1_9BACT|nr:PHP domain-containing protein [Fulvivirgaceae bacterium BMA10]